MFQREFAQRLGNLAPLKQIFTDARPCSSQARRRAVLPPVGQHAALGARRACHEGRRHICSIHSTDWLGCRWARTISARRQKSSRAWCALSRATRRRPSTSRFGTISSTQHIDRLSQEWDGLLRVAFVRKNKTLGSCFKMTVQLMSNQTSIQFTRHRACLRCLRRTIAWCAPAPPRPWCDPFHVAQ